MGPRRKISDRDIVLILWGVLIAFAIQVFYDTFDNPVITAIMPKAWWGLMITAIFAFCLFGYIALSSRKEKEKEKAA